MNFKKVAINVRHGGFALSPKATKRYWELKGKMFCEDDVYVKPEDREDPDLIRVIEELGEEASARFSQLKIVEIPSDVEYTIQEYDGLEHVAEKHRTWD